MEHLAVWIDHVEARVFNIDAANVEALALHAPHHHVRRHPRSTAEHAHPSDSEHFYHDVARSLAEAKSVLVLGPSTAKLELMRHLHRHDAEIEKKIVGVETVDHPTDKQIVAYARKYFVAKDQMLGRS